MKRLFLIVLDSVGIGEAPDAAEYGDQGSNTIRSVSKSSKFHMPNMQSLGMFNIDGVDCIEGVDKPLGAYARLTEASKGKDTTTGHWELAGIISREPMPTFPNGFPKELIKKLEERTGRKVLCNKPYSGTEVIKDYGQEHEKTGDLIVYTSADSVLQIAAHEEVIPVEKLYEYCQIARDLCTGPYGVGRVIARPFIGTYPDYTRTSNRHDFSLQPPGDTMLDILKHEGLDVIGIGKINDIFAGKGLTDFVLTKDNADGIERILEYTQKDFNGLCFIYLVDFDMRFGHRNDVDGYAEALSYFDNKFPEIMKSIEAEDAIIITADHGCDPGTESTDHSREYTPFLIYGHSVKAGVNCGTRSTFADVAATILDLFNISYDTISGTSMKEEILKQ